MRTLIFFCSVLLLLSSCIEEDHSCDYMDVQHRWLYSQAWQVDTFHLYVHDSISNYHFDTTYTAAGDWNFVPGSNEACALSGKILFKQGGGSTILIPYQLTWIIQPNQMALNLTFPDSLDGYSPPPSQPFCIQYYGNSVVIASGYQKQGYCAAGDVEGPVVHAWRFVLSPKP